MKRARALVRLGLEKLDPAIIGLDQRLALGIEMETQPRRFRIAAHQDDRRKIASLPLALADIVDTLAVGRLPPVKPTGAV